MTFEEISSFAHVITYVNQRTILAFKNRNIIVGYFEGNATNDELKKQNRWEFIPTPQENNAKNKIIINGDDLVSIQIINVW